MPMIDPTEHNWDDFVDPYALPDGSPARLRIIEVTRQVKTYGDIEVTGYTVRKEVVDHDYAKEIYTYLEFPNSKFRGKDDKRYNRQGAQWRNFCKCFDIPLNEATDPLTDWKDHEGDVILSKNDDTQFGETNRIRKYL